MPCKRCGSSYSREFPAVIDIRPSYGMEDQNLPPVWAFPKLVICRCGFTECVLVDAELQLLDARESPREKFVLG
jgi:hypothetical protein